MMVQAVGMGVNNNDGRLGEIILARAKADGTLAHKIRGGFNIKSPLNTVVIVDARPWENAMANAAMNAGTRF
jgi:hypothetical protein